MRPSEALSQHRARIREIALNHHVSNVRVFGSVSRGEDGPDSDLDMLVTRSSGKPSRTICHHFACKS